ncbi:MAG TPA: histone deacetylase [Chitinophagales bacterium]|nr:histone deacetylase [Chitinophagales bacterium]
MLKIAFASQYVLPLPANHRFPISKYELIPLQLLHEGTVLEENFFEPVSLDPGIVALTHTREYIRRLINLEMTPPEMRKIGFPQTPELIDREFIIAGGTVECCDFAMLYGVSLNIAGGTHHAYADKGEGFCLLNDCAIAANYLLLRKSAQKILIVDLDVHQGQGTAKIFEHEPRVFTFSMHGKNNYPSHKEKSTLDVELHDGMMDGAYLTLLKKHLPDVIESFKPDFAFYISGVDIISTDRFGKLNVSMDGCKRRDAFVFEILKKHHIPVVVTMGGGYSPDIKDILEAHCNTFRMAKEIYF